MNKGGYQSYEQMNSQQFYQGNQRKNSPNKQGQSLYNRNYQQNYNNNNNISYNKNQRGRQQNQNIRETNQRFNQEGFNNEQNNRSRSSNQRNQGSGVDRDWQQSKVQYKSSNFDHNQGSNNQQRQMSNKNQFQRQAKNFPPNKKNPNYFTKKKNNQKSLQNNNNSNNNKAVPRPPPLPSRNQNAVNQNNKPNNQIQKRKPYVNKDMKQFINDEDEDFVQNSSNEQEDVEQNQEGNTQSYEENEDEYEQNIQDDDQTDDEEEDNQEDDDLENSQSGSQNEDQYDSSQDDQNVSESQHSDNSGYNENKFNQRKGEVRELVIKRRVGQQPEESDTVTNINQSDVNLNFSLNNSDASQLTIAEQKKILSQMCHETIDNATWEQHKHKPLFFAFFEKNQQGQPQKNLAMKIYYRSAAAKELVMGNILSPIGIKKSADRMIDEILDYFLQPNIDVKELVGIFTDRLRCLIAELEPLSQHLSLYNPTKMMVEIKELLLVISLAGVNYLRKQSCLDNHELENGYNEKKLFEHVQFLSDNLIMVYEQNVAKIKSIIEKKRNVDIHSLKKQILENESVYISPLVPKVISWRLLFRLDDQTSLHKMDDLLNMTYDSLVLDESFCAIFELVTNLTKKNYFQYFEMLNKDKRIDYISANASLLCLSTVRLNYILYEKQVTGQTLQNLQFDLNSQYDKDSATRFLSKLAKKDCNFENLEDINQYKVNCNNSDSISLGQLFWPNFYQKIEWRKPNSFKETIRKILKDSENSKFSEALIENMIKKDRKIPITNKQPVKQVAIVKQPQIQEKPVVEKKLVNKIAPTLNFNISMKKDKQDLIVQEQINLIQQEKLKRQISAEQYKKVQEEQQRNKFIERWGILIKQAQSQFVNQLVSAIQEYNQLEFYESYLCLKFFQTWKNNYKYAKYKNKQNVCYGINNEPIVIKKSSILKAPDAAMEVEQEQEQDKKNQQKDQTSFYKDFIKTFDFEKQSKIGEETHKFLDMMSMKFLKEKNKMFTHFYYKITIISDEQNPLIESMVNSLSNYFSQNKNNDGSFWITIQIEDITIEYTLQLQMAKHLDKINTKQLSGTDLFIYIFTEQDDELNQQYYGQFKKHLEILSRNKFSLGFNLLFLSVNEISKENISKPSNKSSGYSLIKNNDKFGKHLYESPSQGLSNHNMTRSMSSHTAYQMMLDMSYTNPDVQDSEGFVRSAIKYLNSRFDLKKDVEQNSIYQYYNVISYTYEKINGNCINENPFSDRMFKASVDSAIEKSIHVKSPFGKITFTSLSIELQKIRQILSFGKELSQFSSSRSNSGLPPLPPSGNVRSLYKQLKEFLIKEQILDVKKHSDMKNYFYFKHLFNNTMYQLFENFLSIMEQSHLIPFDQLNEFEQSQLILLEQTLEIVKEQLDKMFLKDSNKYLKLHIRKNYFTNFTYENIIKVVDQYYKNLLEMSSSELDSDFDNDITMDSSDNNQDAYQSLVDEMIEVVKQNFTFSQKKDHGVVGNWQAVFVKLIDQLIAIFQENDIPMFLSQNFKFKFDCKQIKKNIQEEFNKMELWLSELQQTNYNYLNRTISLIGDQNYQEQNNPNKKLKTDQYLQQTKFDDSQSVVRLYNEIIQYNQTNLQNSTHQIYNTQASQQNHLQGNQKKETTLANGKHQNQDTYQNQVLNNEKQSSLSYSNSEYSSVNSSDEEIKEISSGSQENEQNKEQSESNSAQDYSEEEKPAQNKNFNKRRTACLVPNKKDEIDNEVQYGEKIKKLMRGEIENSPTHLDDSFV